MWLEHGLVVQGVHRCPVRGARGNQEYFVHLVHNEGEEPTTAGHYAKMINEAIKGGTE